MNDYLLFLFLGLSIGSVYAALALGITLTYQGSGVINFAAGAMATVPLYVYDDLRNGLLTVPLPWVPTYEVDVPPTAVAVAIAVVVAALLGALVELLVFRPIRSAPVLAKVVAAVGVMLTIQAAVALKYGGDPRPAQVLLPTGTTSIGGAEVPTDRLWYVAFVVVSGIVLVLWFGRSRLGLAVQAAAENQRAAEFARLSPSKLGAATWIVSSAYVSLAMILAGPAIGVIAPSNLTLLVVPALAAALIGRLSSLGSALVGGLVIGVVSAELQFLSLTKTWWPSWAKQGITDAVPFVVIVIVLFVMGRSIPMRGDDTSLALPAVRLPRNRPILVALAAVGGVAAVVLTTGSYRFGVINSLAISLIALSLVLLTGMVGQISLAQAGLAGVAGLAVAKMGTDVPFPLSLLIAAGVASLVGVLIGLPALRIRGAQLAVVTLAAAVTLQKLVLGNSELVSATTDKIPDPELFGINLGVRDGTDVARVPFGLMVLVVVLVSFVVVNNLIRGGTGRAMLAIRSNERAAASVGLNVAGVKILAFALASFLAGLGGALIGYSRGQLSPESFGVFVGLSLLAVAYLGGITSAAGALVAGVMGTLGIAFVIIDRNLDVGTYYPLVTGLGLILTVLFNPTGIAGGTRAFIERLRRNPADGGGGSEPLAAELTSARAPRLAPRPPLGEVCFRTDEVRVRYGGVTAVDGLSIEVREGEIVGLIGPNGAGKTSFIDAVSGFTRSSGRVELAGQDVSDVAPYRRSSRGLARTWQSMELFDDLTVLGNVQVADDAQHGLRRVPMDMVRPSRPASAAVTDALSLLALDHLGDRQPSELSLGQQKLLGVARALALQPKVLLLDEPAAGLDTAESIEFGQDLRRIAATGVGCLLVDHDMHLVLGVCDRIYVVEFGRHIAVGTPEEIRRDPRVLAAYLGNDHLEASRPVASEPVIDAVGGAR